MKKIIFTLTLVLSFSNGFAAEVIRIYNQNPQYSVFVNYEACFRDFKKINQPVTSTSCLLPIFHLTIPKGRPYINVKLPEYVDYARVINAYDIGDGIVAEGQFPGEEDCKSWSNYPVTLDNRNSNTIYCTRN